MKVSPKKEEFLQESLVLIHEKGFKATTIRDIAERLNFDKSNCYNYIKSKQEILESFLFRTSNEFHDGIKNIMESNYSAEDKLKSLISSHIRIASEKPYEVALLVNEWRNLKEPKYSEFVTLREEYENKVSELLKGGMQTKVFKKMDLKIATSVVLASLRWFYDQYTTKKEASINPVEFERQIVGFILSGIRV